VTGNEQRKIETPHPGIDRMRRLREDLAKEISQRERELAGLRAKLAGFDEAVAIIRECADEEC
jgi:hypothetical protein